MSVYICLYVYKQKQFRLCVQIWWMTTSIDIWICSNTFVLDSVCIYIYMYAYGGQMCVHVYFCMCVPAYLESLYLHLKSNNM